MNRGAKQATAHGVAKSQTQPSTHITPSKKKISYQITERILSIWLSACSNENSVIFPKKCWVVRKKGNKSFFHTLRECKR